MYTAAVLEPQSRHLLRWITQAIINQDHDVPNDFFNFETDRGMLLPHHMTINLGKFDNSLNDGNALRKEASLFVKEIVYDPEMGVVAARVNKAIAYCQDSQWPIFSTNIHPHITIGLFNAAPKISNDLLAEAAKKEHRGSIRIEKLDQEYELYAHIEECA